MNTIPQDVPQKQCCKCKVWFPATGNHFSRDRSTSDGFYPRCKTCRRSPERGTYNLSESGRKKLREIGETTYSKVSEERRLAFHVSGGKVAGKIAAESHEGKMLFGGHWVPDTRSEDPYDMILEMQGGTCAICGKIPSGSRRYAIDHDHQTNEVRGVLCHVCNRFLGGFEKHHDQILIYLNNHHTGIQFAKWRQASRSKTGKTIERANSRQKSPYRMLSDQQSGLCAYCQRPPKSGLSLCIDHNHVTNEVRALLCISCNVFIGTFERRYEVIMNYLANYHTGIQYGLHWHTMRRRKNHPLRRDI